MSLLKYLVPGIFCLLCTWVYTATAADWPADTGTEIGQIGQQGGLPDGYEPSGAVWHTGRQKLIIVDDSGLISAMDLSGSNITTWDVEEDLEGITLIDPEGDLVYLAVEHPDSILEFNLATGALTGNQWDLTPWLDGPSNHGLEALTYGNGHFFAGLQEDGNIFIFNLFENGIVEHLNTVASHENRDDISGLHFDPCTEILYAIHDSDDIIVELTSEGSFIREYELLGDAQEGVAIIGGGTSMQTTIFIAQDSGEVWRYEQYPVESCLPATTGEPQPELNIHQLGCSPNPFNPLTQIFFELNSHQWVDLSIKNLRGQHMCTLINGALERGEHRVNWNGRADTGISAPSGIYFAHLNAGKHNSTTKLMLIR